MNKKLLLLLFFLTKDMHKEKWDIKTSKWKLWKMPSSSHKWWSEAAMPLLPVHQCGQAQLFPVMRRLEELVIFHQPNLCAATARTSPAMWSIVTEHDVTIPPAQDLG